MHWLIWQLLAVISITSYIAVANHYGKISLLHGHIGFCIAVATLGWTVTMGYISAPTFVKAYMIQNGLLPITGILVSVLFFKEFPSIWQYAGTVFIAIGILLMVK